MAKLYALRGEIALAARDWAGETIDAVAARAPEPALRSSFLPWPRVTIVREDVDRFHRA